MKDVLKYGRRVREERVKRGWSQEHLAALATTDVRTIQRVESDRTQGLDTLAAIAGALDLEVGGLAQKYRVAESWPPKACEIESVNDLRAAIRSASHECAIRTLVSELPQRIDEILASVVEDLQYISPDESDLFESFLESMRGPLEEMHSLGFSLFSIQERREFFRRFHPDEKPVAFENWGFNHLIVIPRYGCFRDGGPNSGEALHRFNGSCQALVQQVLRCFEKEVEVGVFPNILHAMLHSSGGAGISKWCDVCFPENTGGGRISMEYLAQIVGTSVEDLRMKGSEAMEEFAEDPPIVGHA